MTTPFIIYSVLLTLVLIVYYAVVIVLDLRKTGAGDAKDDEQSFDVSDIAGQAPESIIVQGDDFSQSDDSHFHFGDTDNGNNSDGSSDDEQMNEPSPAELHAENCRQQMEEIEPLDKDTFSYNDGSIFEYITQEQEKTVKVKEYPMRDKI